jgi:hypothetical protein
LFARCTGQPSWLIAASRLVAALAETKACPVSSWAGVAAPVQRHCAWQASAMLPLGKRTVTGIGYSLIIGGLGAPASGILSRRD